MARFIQVIVAIAEEDGTVVDRLDVLVPAAMRSRVDGKVIDTLERAGADIREYLELRYEVKE